MTRLKYLCFIVVMLFTPTIWAGGHDGGNASFLWVCHTKGEDPIYENIESIQFFDFFEQKDEVNIPGLQLGHFDSSRSVQEIIGQILEPLRDVDPIHHRVFLTKALEIYENIEDNLTENPLQVSEDNYKGRFRDDLANNCFRQVFANQVANPTLSKRRFLFQSQYYYKLKDNIAHGRSILAAAMLHEAILFEALKVDSEKILPTSALLNNVRYLTYLLASNYFSVVSGEYKEYYTLLNDLLLIGKSGRAVHLDDGTLILLNHFYQREHYDKRIASGEVASDIHIKTETIDMMLPRGVYVQLYVNGGADNHTYSFDEILVPSNELEKFNRLYPENKVKFLGQWTRAGFHRYGGSDKFHIIDGEPTEVYKKRSFHAIRFSKNGHPTQLELIEPLVISSHYFAHSPQPIRINPGAEIFHFNIDNPERNETLHLDIHGSPPMNLSGSLFQITGTGKFTFERADNNGPFYFTTNTHFNDSDANGWVIHNGQKITVRTIKRTIDGLLDSIESKKAVELLVNGGQYSFRFKGRISFNHDGEVVFGVLSHSPNPQRHSTETHGWLENGLDNIRPAKRAMFWAGKVGYPLSFHYGYNFKKDRLAAKFDYDDFVWFKLKEE